MDSKLLNIRLLKGKKLKPGRYPRWPGIWLILVNLSVIVPFFIGWKKSLVDDLLLVLGSGVVAYAGRFLWRDKVVAESDGDITEAAEVAKISIPAYIIVAVFLVVYLILVVRVILGG